MECRPLAEKALFPEKWSHAAALLSDTPCSSLVQLSLRSIAQRVAGSQHLAAERGRYRLPNPKVLALFKFR